MAPSLPTPALSVGIRSSRSRNWFNPTEHLHKLSEQLLVVLFTCNTFTINNLNGSRWHWRKICRPLRCRAFYWSHPLHATTQTGLAAARHNVCNQPYERMEMKKTAVLLLRLKAVGSWLLLPPWRCHRVQLERDVNKQDTLPMNAKLGTSLFPSWKREMCIFCQIRRNLFLTLRIDSAHKNSDI